VVALAVTVQCQFQGHTVQQTQQSVSYTRCCHPLLVNFEIFTRFLKRWNKRDFVDADKLLVMLFVSVHCVAHLYTYWCCCFSFSDKQYSNVYTEMIDAV